MMTSTVTDRQVHTCQPKHVRRPGAALQCLSRYVAGSAISDVRIVSDIDGEVTIRIKDYQNGGQRKTLSMPGEEFVARFALHILPPHFFRVRYAGWLGNRFRTVNLEKARAALNVIVPKEEESERNVVDLEELLSRQLGDTTYRCPNCGEAQLQWEGELRGTVGWQRQRSQKPPMARARTANWRRRKATYDKHDSPSTRAEDWLMIIPMSHTSTASLVYKASPQRESELVGAEMKNFRLQTDSGPPAARFLPNSWRSTLVSISNSLGHAAEKAIACHQSSVS